MKTLLLLCSLWYIRCGGIPSDGEVAVVTELPSTPRPLPSTPRPAKITDDYSAAHAEALREGRPLLVWVGQRPRTLGGAVCVYQPTFKFGDGTAVQGPAVVVSVPKGTWMEWVATIQTKGFYDNDVMEKIHEALHGSTRVERDSGASPAAEEGPARVLKSKRADSVSALLPPPPMLTFRSVSAGLRSC